MLKLRKILLLNYPYIILLILVLLISTIRIATYHRKEISNNITSSISSYQVTDDKLVIYLNRYKVICNYYFKSNKENNYLIRNIKLGDIYNIKGIIKIPEEPTTKGLFNYRKYLRIKNIDYIMTIKSIKKIKSTNNVFYLFKRSIIKRLNNNPYLYTFLLGDKSLINKDVLTSYQENGISHLFAISGMHISLLSGIILKVLGRLNENKRYLLTGILLFIYLLLVGFSPSILRGVLFFYIFNINKIYYFYINKINLYIIVLSITLLINPFYIFDSGFLYSFSISLVLLIKSDYLNTNSYFKSLFRTSLLSFYISLPISLYNYSSINLISIILNLFYVPLVSLVVFPLSLIVFLIPQLSFIYNYLTKLLETTSLLFNRIECTRLIFIRLNIIYYILLFIIILFIITKSTKKNYIIIVILFVHFLYPIIIKNNFIEFINVGQGDSTIIHYNNKTVLIDTGGKVGSTNSIVKNTTINILKQKGIKKIDYLVLTHGDYDHIGEASILIENYRVEKVVFNCGSYNYLEKGLIKLLKKNNIKYYTCIKELNIGTKLYFLNTKEYNDENNNSIVIYTELNGHKFMFMGDAGADREKDIIDKYNISNIDVLKVGHHGSSTSTSIEFIEEMNPKYSIISVGKNNRYGHPNKEALNNLEKSKIYRTDEDGSVIFKVKNNKLKIETCEP